MRISDWSSDVCSSDLRTPGASPPWLPVDGVEAIPQKAQRGGDEDRLIGRESRQIGDPGAAGAEAEENQRQNAAGRRSNSPQDTAGRGPPGANPIALQLNHVLDFYQPHFPGPNHPAVLPQFTLSSPGWVM